MTAEIRPILREFTQTMETRLQVGDERGWVWDERAAQTFDMWSLIDRAISNLLAARRAASLGEAEAAEECFADAANLSMFAWSTMCALAKLAGGDLWAGSDSVFDGSPRVDS